MKVQAGKKTGKPGKQISGRTSIGQTSAPARTKNSLNGSSIHARFSKKGIYSAYTLTLIPRNKVEGVVLHPDGADFPAGGTGVWINAADTSGTGSSVWKYASIPEGSNSSLYTITVVGDSSALWRIRCNCSSGCDAYLSNGYFSSSGTTGNYSGATLLPGGDSHPGTDLTLLKDDDDDNIANTEDNFPGIVNGNLDNFDGDDLGDECDLDDDNDGAPDTDEGPLGTNPLDRDHDDDGIRDGLDANPTGFDNTCSGWTE